MTELLERMKLAASRMGDAAFRSLDVDTVAVEAGAIRKVAPYLKKRSFAGIVVVADSNTQAAGSGLLDSLREAGVDFGLTIIQPDAQGDIIADERSIVQLLLDLKTCSAEAVVALGSGTLHDIARFAAYAAGVSFLSVPTAPSVDGFNSKGAPLIVRGEKKTVPAIGPDAIFADLDILTQSPRAMVAAGFGDMVAKYTSLFDWKFGSLMKGEPYSPIVAEVTGSALRQCVEGIEEIALRTPEGIRLLMEGLLESGFAMLLFGQSHPASGAEHHLSHYWEMEFLRLGRKQILHGAKVGVACAEISTLYHRIAKESLTFVPEPHRRVILQELTLMPEADEIRSLLRTVGGPAAPEELGVDSDLFARSLQEAWHIRPNRYTMLRAYVEG